MISVVKGTHDVILDEASKYTYVEQILIRTAELYGYKEFRTPIIESTPLFIRSVGDSSDIVRKEMYTFLDKGERSITLRPELTAGVIRSMVNNKLFVDQDYPRKGYYVGPCFRYERPQQGRYRQFNQFGVECVGVDNSYRDSEVIILAYNGLKMLGFKNITLKINTLGDEESRANYKKVLKEYFASHIDEMCGDCHDRLELNPLRILDCKVPEDQEIVKKAPKMSDFLTESAKNYFNKVLEILKDNEVKYEIDDSLVRGLDYYSGVVFEFHYTSKTGKNYGAIGAGGHYNNLVKELEGPDIEGVGFAMGIERLVSVMNDDEMFNDVELEDTEIDIYCLPIGEENIAYSLKLVNSLRAYGYSCEICLENKGMSQMFKKAERRKAKLALIIGENEIKNEEVVLKDLSTKVQSTVKNADLIEVLDNIFDSDHD